MTADLQDLFDRVGRNAPAPTLDPDAVLHRARRSHNRRVWVSATALAVVAAVVAVVVYAGGGVHLAGPQPATRPSPTLSTYALAADPLLGDGGLGFWGLGPHIPQDNWAVPVPLNPCLTDPLTFGAPHVAAGTAMYRGPFKKRQEQGVRINEYVLAFADAAAAHRVLDEVWAGFDRCHRPAGDDPMDRPSAWPEGSSSPLLDEFFATQRDADPMYAIRVAREGNVVVIIEDTRLSDDRSYAALISAVNAAIPNYLPTHIAAVCFFDPSLCPPGSPLGRPGIALASP